MYLAFRRPLIRLRSSVVARHVNSGHTRLPHQAPQCLRRIADLAIHRRDRGPLQSHAGLNDPVTATLYRQLNIASLVFKGWSLRESRRVAARTTVPVVLFTPLELGSGERAVFVLNSSLISARAARWPFYQSSGPGDDQS